MLQQGGHSTTFLTISASGWRPSASHTNAMICRPSHMNADLRPEIVLPAHSMSARTSSRACMASKMYLHTPVIADSSGSPVTSLVYVERLGGCAAKSSLQGSHHPHEIWRCNTFR